MALITSTQHKHTDYNFGSGSDSRTVSKNVYAGQTVIGSSASAYTPGITTETNCNVTLTVVNGTSLNSNTSWVIDFVGSTTGSWTAVITQGYGSRVLTITGNFVNASSSEPADEMLLGSTTSKIGKSVGYEVGQSGQLSMNDAKVRTLTSTSAGTSLDFEDFYGKTYDDSVTSWPFTPTYSSAAGSNPSYTDNNIPSSSDLGTGNSQITGFEFWRNVRLTYSGTDGATRYLHIRGQRDGAATHYYGDAQVLALVKNANSDGSGGTVYRLYDGNGIMTGWKTYNWDTPDQTSHGWLENQAVTITAANSGSNGRFVIRSADSPTGSSNTGRLENVSTTNNWGWGYFETSQSSAPATYAWLHAKSPAFTLNDGDTLDVYYGVDCYALSSLKFQLIS